MRLDKSSWCCCRSLAYAVIGRSTPQGYRYPDPKGPKGKLFALLQASDSAQDTLSGTHIDDERELMADGVSDVALLVPIPRFLHFQTKNIRIVRCFPHQTHSKSHHPPHHHYRHQRFGHHYTDCAIGNGIHPDTSFVLATRSLLYITTIAPCDREALTGNSISSSFPPLTLDRY